MNVIFIFNIDLFLLSYCFAQFLTMLPLFDENIFNPVWKISVHFYLSVRWFCIRLLMKIHQLWIASSKILQLQSAWS